MRANHVVPLDHYHARIHGQISWELVTLDPVATEDRIARVLKKQPGLTTREIARQLGGVRKRDLNPVLYRMRDRFKSDGGYVPRWFLIEQRTEPRPDRTATTKKVKAELAGLEAQLQAMLGQSALSERTPRRPVANLDWSGEWCIPRLRPWQRRALTAWFDAGGRGIVEAVTGTGKTLVGIEAASRMARMGGRTTILVPTIELQRQWLEKVAEFAPQLRWATVGGHAKGKLAKADVVVAVAASASRRNLVLGERPHLLVADEVHRYGSEQWSAALQDGYASRLGLTATLERGGDDGVDQRLLPYFRSKVFRYTYEQAVPDGVVAPFNLVFLGVDLSLEEQVAYERFCRRITRARAVLVPLGVFRGTPGQVQANLADCRRKGGDLRRAVDEYDKATRGRRNLLAEVQSKPEALAELAPLVSASHGTVVFSQKIAAAERAAEVLSRNGVMASAIHSAMPPKERQFHLEALKSESIAALCAPKILDEGVDVPNVDLGIVLSASSGRRQMIQRLGRVIRLKNGGAHARFVVVYAEGTVEDPAAGAQEGFIDMVRDVASHESVLEVGWSLGDVANALAHNRHDQ